MSLLITIGLVNLVIILVAIFVSISLNPPMGVIGKHPQLYIYWMRNMWRARIGPLNVYGIGWEIRTTTLND